MMKLRSALALALLLVCVPVQAQETRGTTPLSGAKGGTNNAFMQFTGPAGSIKTYALPNASDTIATIAAAQTLTNKTIASATNLLGGVTMALGSDASGDIYYNNAGVLTRLPKGSNGQALELVSGLPAWATLAGTGTVTSVTCGSGLSGGTITITGTCAVTAAAKSDQQAASSTTLTVTPSQQQSHPSAAKAWASFNGVGSIGSLASYNVASVVRNTAGNYTITWTTPFTTPKYAFLLTCNDNGSGAGSMGTVSTLSATAVTFLCVTPTTYVQVDASIVSVVAFGTQ